MTEANEAGIDVPEVVTDTLNGINSTITTLYDSDISQ